MTKFKEKKPIEINWEVLPADLVSLPFNHPPIPDDAEKELKKIRNYLTIPKLNPGRWHLKKLFSLTRRLSSTSTEFDMVVGYFLKELEVPIFITDYSEYTQILAAHIDTSQRLITNVLDLIDLLGIRKTAAIINIKSQKDDQKDKLENTARLP